MQKPPATAAVLTFAYSDRYPLQLPPTHPFPHQKYDLLRAELLHQAAVQPAQLYQPTELLPPDILTLAHTPEYWHRLTALALTPAEIRRIGLPLTQRFVQRAHASATNSFHAALRAADYGIGMHLGGGTHHAYADRGEGYCLLNDAAVCIRYLLAEGRIARPLVVDLDVHQGNGTAHLFQGDAAVFTFSMHAERNYPHPKEQSTLDVGLPDGTTDEAYLAQLDTYLPAIVDAHRPDLLFYIAGSDVLATDRLGRLSLTHAGAEARDRRVLSLAHRLGIPVVLTLGGGYSRDIRDSIQANVRTVQAALDIWD